MLTNNFIRMFGSDSISIDYSDWHSQNPAMGCAPCIESSNVFLRGRWLTRGYAWYLMIGSGNTAVTPEDIHLANIINLDPASYTMVQNTSDSNNILKKIIYKITNTTTEDIVVREIGMGIYCGDNYGRGANFMVARKVLSTPVTIHVGETYNFSYAIYEKEGD